MRAIQVHYIDVSKRKCTLARCERSAIRPRTTDARHSSSREPQSYTAVPLAIGSDGGMIARIRQKLAAQSIVSTAFAHIVYR